MGVYFFRRSLQMIVVLFVMSVIVFGMLRLIPGDPATIFIGTEGNQEAVEAMRRQLGLDRPIYIQYVLWIQKVLEGDFGISFLSKQPALSLLATKLPATLLLTAAAAVIGLGIAFPVGIISGLKPHSWVDNLATMLSLLGIAVPTFWLGMLLVLNFGVKWQLLPTGGYVKLTDDPLLSLKHLILPASTLGLHLAATQTRFIRSGMLDVMSSDYIRTARGKGLSESVVIRVHALKNTLITVVTVLALDLGALLGGAIVTEAVFVWPGVGTLLVTSIGNRDYPVIQVVILFTVLVYTGANFLTDLSYAFLDPRVRTDR